MYAEKDKYHVKLSDTQPFLRELDGKASNNPQYMRPITPFIINDDNLEALPEETKNMGTDYIQQKNIQTILQQIFHQKIKPELSKPIVIYDGLGITLQNIENALMEQDKEAQLQAKKHFNDYKMLKNQKQFVKIEKSLTNIKDTDENTYNYLQKLIENHEKKK